MSKARRPKPIFLVGGGSGGHIIPNLAIANVLKKGHPNIPLIYVGSRKAKDRNWVGTAMPYYGIFAGKLRRYFRGKIL
ncbi:glycosyltransferase [Candidatus Peregrinibacteria bacterium]|nr:MAG: glycosyltransferase [Candidatus Peregrinibacteria bacterium]